MIPLRYFNTFVGRLVHTKFQSKTYEIEEHGSHGCSYRPPIAALQQGPLSNRWVSLLFLYFMNNFLDIGMYPYRIKCNKGKNLEYALEVLVISAQRKGKGMLFPKGGWEAGVFGTVENKQPSENPFWCQSHVEVLACQPEFEGQMNMQSQLNLDGSEQTGLESVSRTANLTLKMMVWKCWKNTPSLVSLSSYIFQSLSPRHSSLPNLSKP
ncbi:hypothetical protein L2E82_20550 [Cichorium intybus]|uniref:Uncharacterized protein n=1 Tax=Cichorium intybus TaxID=13427 RepID=A0ACB9DTE9_CICIN|nr:hypothetical protein L2E82_20550 [Cichorium intybus]